MNNPERIAIYGVGLMGASLAMALTGFASKIIGIDPDKSIHEQATGLGIVNQILAYPPSQKIRADLIILSAPVMVNLEILAALDRYHEGSAIVLDLSSTKYEVCQAMNNLPEQFDPIGGHPICGKEQNSLEFADPEMFKGATFVLTPLPRTTPAAHKVASNLVEHIGSHPIWVDAASHDQIVAATSHLPYLIANALASITPPEKSNLVGPGFISTSRLAASNTKMMLDILKTNRQNVLQVLNEYDRQLDALKTSLENEDYDTLETLMIAGRDARYRLLAPTYKSEKS
jgi:prephenate dehydrogenase